jgi:hypothetical protein
VTGVSGAVGIAIAAVGLLPPPCARAQEPTTEASMSTGISTEDSTAAVATQIRAFGAARPGIRYYAEGSWARRSEDESDAFGAAYPYSNRVRVVEAFGEWMVSPRRALVAVRAGRYRTPFGISAGSDHAYTGFLRAPLVRYDGYFALSNNFLEHGVDVMLGTPGLSVETSVGRPADIGLARRPGIDAIVRVQGYVAGLIIGASHIRTQPYQPAEFATGRAEFTGLDARFTRSGVTLRGELVAGRPFAGVTTVGWYGDAILHRVAMGPLTAVARVEQLDYDTPFVAFALHTKRQTLGARVRLRDALSLQVNLLHQTGQLNSEYGPVALDVGFTWTVRRR